MEDLWLSLCDQRWWILIIALVVAGAIESKKFSGAFLWFVIGIFLMYASYILPYYIAEMLAVLGIFLLLDFPKWLLYPIIAIGAIGLGAKIFTACSLSTSLIIIAIVVVVVILLLCKGSINSYFLHRKYGGHLPC